MLKKFLSLLILIFAMFSMSSCMRDAIVNDNADNEVARDIKTFDNFIIETNKNMKFELDKRDKTKLLLVNFWATWCNPCVEEMPALQKVYDEYSDRVDFLLINSGEKKEVVDEFLNKSAILYSFPFGYDEKDDLSIKYDIQAIPTTFILDGENNIIIKLVGSRSDSEYKEIIDKVLEYVK